MENSNDEKLGKINKSNNLKSNNPIGEVQLRNLPTDKSYDINTKTSSDNSFFNESVSSPETGRSRGFLFKDPKISEQQFSQEEKAKQLFFWYCFYHIIPILASLAIVIMHYLTKDKLKVSEVAYFGNIGKNWNLSPVVSVHQCTNNEDKSDNLLSFEKWPGLNTGCKCSSGLLFGPCNKLNKRSRCLTQHSVDPIGYEVWKNRNICFKRLDKNYLQMNITEKSTNCKKGKKPCGLIDNLGNILCLNENEDCPINNILNFKTKEEINAKNLNGSSLVLDSNGIKNVLLFTRDNILDGNLPIEFRTSTGLPCKNPYFTNMNYKIYMLNKFFNKQRCLNFSDSIPNDNMEYSFDNSFYQIDEIYKKTFYYENKIEKILRSSEFNYELDSELDRNIQLYTKNYFGLKFNCFQKLQFDQEKSQKIINSLLNLFDVEELIEDYTWQGWFYIIFFGMGFIILLCSLIITENRKYANNRLSKRWDVKIFYIIATFFVLGLGIYILIIQSNLKKLLKFEKYLNGIFDSNDCVDEYTIQLYKRITLNINTINKDFLIIEFMIGFIFIFHFMFIGCLFYKI
jgi:hypothetical protein